MKTLSELFASFTADAQLDSALTSGEVTKVNIQNEYRLITLWVNFSSLIDRSELIAAEKLYSQALNA